MSVPLFHQLLLLATVGVCIGTRMDVQPSLFENFWEDDKLGQFNAQTDAIKQANQKQKEAAIARTKDSKDSKDSKTNWPEEKARIAAEIAEMKAEQVRIAEARLKLAEERAAAGRKEREEEDKQKAADVKAFQERLAKMGMWVPPAGEKSQTGEAKDVAATEAQRRAAAEAEDAQRAEAAARSAREAEEQRLQRKAGVAPVRAEDQHAAEMEESPRTTAAQDLKKNQEQRWKDVKEQEAKKKAAGERKQEDMNKMQIELERQIENMTFPEVLQAWGIYDKDFSKAVKKGLIKFHPDRIQQDPIEAEVKFKLLPNLYEEYKTLHGIH